ncbi:MAG: NAD-dependent deacylase [Acidobacteria bacterium]|nr:MAG: NAD-dependent deacylase [Acidobacteriota bacterium]
MAEAAAWIRNASRAAALTGAGVSAESGVPTFRGAGGLWEGHRIEEVATPEAFDRDPVLVWEFYDARRTGLVRCRPNRAHEALAELERRISDFTLITQNVDDLHRAAGSRKLIELHGNLWRMRCTAGCGEWEDRRAPLPRPLPPACRCGAPARPAIVWFGEWLDPADLAAAEAAAARAEVFLVIGTSGIVEPAASLARTAAAAGARVVEINPEPTPLSAVAALSLRGPAGEIVPRLVGTA